MGLSWIESDTLRSNMCGTKRCWQQVKMKFNNMVLNQIKTTFLRQTPHFITYFCHKTGNCSCCNHCYNDNVLGREQQQNTFYCHKVTMFLSGGGNGSHRCFANTKKLIKITRRGAVWHHMSCPNQTIKKLACHREGLSNKICCHSDRVGLRASLIHGTESLGN